MHPRKFSNYLRTYRKRAGLSQRRVAFLLGRPCRSFVSRSEDGSRSLSLATALAYAAIYNTSVEELFAGEYARVRAEVRKRQTLQAINTSDIYDDT